MGILTILKLFRQTHTHTMLFQIHRGLQALHLPCQPCLWCQQESPQIPPGDFVRRIAQWIQVWLISHCPTDSRATLHLNSTMLPAEQGRILCGFPASLMNIINVHQDRRKKTQNSPVQQ